MHRPWHFKTVYNVSNKKPTINKVFFERAPVVNDWKRTNISQSCIKIALKSKKYSALCIVYIFVVYCAMFVLYDVHCVDCILCSVHFAYCILCTLHTVLCIVCALNIVYCCIFYYDAIFGIKKMAFSEGFGSFWLI